MRLKEYITEYVSSGRGKHNGFNMPKSLSIEDITEWLEDIGIPFIKNGGSGNEVCWFMISNERNICIHFPPSVTGLDHIVQFVIFKKTIGGSDKASIGAMESDLPGKFSRTIYKFTDSNKTEEYFTTIYDFAKAWT